MSRIEFDRSAHLVRLKGADDSVLAGPFEAYNNTDSHSKGPWPDGSYAYLDYNSHAALSDPDSEYGVDGILIFDVPGRLGMGVHSGRRSIPDGLGRLGPAHCTLGCVRTTDEAMAAFIRLSGNDGIQSISIGIAFGIAAVLPKPARPAPRKAKRGRKPPAARARKRVSRRTDRSAPKK
jgi:hypothetical protein